MKLDDHEVALRFDRDGTVDLLHVSTSKRGKRRKTEEDEKKPIVLLTFSDTYEAERFAVRLLKALGAADGWEATDLADRVF